MAPPASPPASAPPAAKPPPHRRVRTPSVLQMEAVECGAAALAMVLGYHGRWVSLEELRISCGVSRDGAKASNLLRSARTYGMTAKGYRKEPAALRGMALPLIVFWNFNHFLVVEGFSEGRVWLNDPAGGRRSVSDEEFDQSFTGVVLGVEPGPDFQRGGERPSVVRSLAKRFRGNNQAMAFLIVCGLALVLPGLVLPVFARLFVDEILVAQRESWLAPLLLGMAATGVLRAALKWVEQHYLLRLETKMALATSAQFFWHVLRLPVEFYTQRSVGDIGNRVDIADRIARMLGNDLATTLLGVATSLFFGALMFAYDPLLALIAVVTVVTSLGAMQWTAGRKKDSLQRVLEGSKNSATRLHQRLSQLVGGWDSDTLDDSLLEVVDAPPDAPEAVVNGQPAAASAATSQASAAAPTAKPNPSWSPLADHAVAQLHGTLVTALPDSLSQAQEAKTELQQALQQGRQADLPPAALDAAQQQITQACDQARRIIEHRYHLVEQLNELCHTLTDSLVELAEDDSWVQGQCQAMQFQLEEGLHSRGVKHMQDLLDSTRQRQKQLKLERDSARQSLKQFIHQMLQEIAALGSTTDRFQQSLGRYAETIGEADSLESLAGVVRDMVEESRAVHGLVNQAQTRMQAEHERATELTDRVRSLEDEIRRLSDEVSTDPLTQIANRRGMAKAFETERARMQRSGGVLAIGLLDVDNFKKLNDQMGHHTGDLALQFLSRRVGECLRPSDSLARYGGEEFVVLLPDTPVDEAQSVLTRLQRTLSAEFFTQDEKKVFITFSAGVTQYRADEAIEAALDRADVALYEAKQTGKNRTCVG
ncbi:MAG: diguanylate cyclase [Rubrivivax sp.]|nr:MAG: diguanylate cyclase [Rubrivivax sp.]